MERNVKKKSAIKFAQRLFDFLESAPEVEVIGGDEINLAKVHIPRTAELQAGEAFAGFVKAERNALKEQAESYDFPVIDDTDEDKDPIEITLRYHSMQKIEGEIYFFFEIRQSEDTDENETEVKEEVSSVETTDENEEVRAG